MVSLCDNKKVANGSYGISIGGRRRPLLQLRWKSNGKGAEREGNKLSKAEHTWRQACVVHLMIWLFLGAFAVMASSR